MKIRNMLAAAIIGVAASGTLHAGVGADQAARLGADLTPVGAEKAGNKDGSIPAWDGKGVAAPAGWKAGGEYPDPYRGEKPLYSVTKDNLAQYAGIVSEGTQALARLIEAGERRLSDDIEAALDADPEALSAMAGRAAL